MTFPRVSKIWAVKKEKTSKENYNFSKLLSFTNMSLTEVASATSKTRMSANTFEKENKFPTSPDAEGGRSCASNTVRLVGKTTSSWHSQASAPHPLSLAVRFCWTSSSASFFKTKGANSRQLYASADIPITHKLQLLLRKGEGPTKPCVPDPGGLFIYPKVSQIVLEANMMTTDSNPRGHCSYHCSFQGQKSPLHWQYNTLQIFSLQVQHWWMKVNSQTWPGQKVLFIA